jgi:DNA helicase HerA-like ATPase
MNIISSNSENPLKIGKYTISEESDANLDGNKFFQRHAVIVGGTGSGKSWTVALLSSILSATAFLIILEIKPIIFSPVFVERICII